MPPRRALIAALLAAACASPAPPPSDAGARDAGPDVALPNLTAVVRFPLVQEREFTAGSCDVIEGCTVPGRRRLLRFDLSTPNLGAGDLALGPPTLEGRATPGFAWSECHAHYHLEGYADFRLVATDGRAVGRGHKQSFCLEDTERVRAGPPLADADRFTCGRQGIHAGWTDVYPRGLDCQYVDVTDVPPGRYRIRATVNAERRLAESNYGDNVGEFEVELAPRDPDAGAPDAAVDGSTVDPTLPCATSEQGVHRECGWGAEEATRRCAPGAPVTVACDPTCGAALGRCEGDPMLRVCEGDGACEASRALAANDDACGDGGRNPCARVTFRCPAAGAYRVLTGAYRAGSAYTCQVEAR